MGKVNPAVTTFLRAGAAASPDGELLVVPQWQRADWEALFSRAQHIKAARGSVLIRQDEPERTLYFVASGLLEVTSVVGNLSLGAIARFHPGSVVGELSFLDGQARSAEVRAVADSELYRLDFRDYQDFAVARPSKACDLVFAIGRVVAMRLRRTLSNIERL